MLSMTSPMIVKRPTIIRDIITRVLTSTLLGYKMQKKKNEMFVGRFWYHYVGEWKGAKKFSCR